MINQTALSLQQAGPGGLRQMNAPAGTFQGLIPMNAGLANDGFASSMDGSLSLGADSGFGGAQAAPSQPGEMAPTGGETTLPPGFAQVLMQFAVACLQLLSQMLVMNQEQAAPGCQAPQEPAPGSKNPPQGDSGNVGGGNETVKNPPTGGGVANAETETNQAIQANFDKLDANGDMILTREELARAEGLKGVDKAVLETMLDNFEALQVARDENEQFDSKKWLGLSRADLGGLNAELQNGSTIAEAAAKFSEAFMADAPESAPENTPGNVPENTSGNAPENTSGNSQAPGVETSDATTGEPQKNNEPEKNNEEEAVQVLLDRLSSTNPQDRSYGNTYQSDELVEVAGAATQAGNEAVRDVIIEKILRHQEDLSALDGRPGALSKKELEGIQGLIQSGWSLDALAEEGRKAKENGRASILTQNPIAVPPPGVGNQKQRDAVELLLKYRADVAGDGYSEKEINLVAGLTSDPEVQAQLKTLMGPNSTSLSLLDGQTGELNEAELRAILQRLEEGSSLGALIEEGRNKLPRGW